jgi:beta-lactamase class D
MRLIGIGQRFARILPESPRTIGPSPAPDAPMDRLATSLLLLFTGLGASAAETISVPQWRRHFDAKGVQGTFVLFEPMENRYRVLDIPRAQRRFIPASTFKIANALIGLEVGSISDENEVFHWDGKPKPIAAWERDHTLESGMRESVVWMFQEIARRTGRARMKEWLERLDYGNRDMSGGIDLFWLQGGLRIGAMEQVAFLHRLAEGRLPATQRAQRLVRNALVAEKTRDYTLYAKTGTMPGGREPVMWWVGWVERKGRPQAYFAMNLTPGAKTSHAERMEIGRAILRDAGVL